MVLAFFNNLSFGETVMIVIVAVLVFGKRLPEVAAQAARHLAKAKRAMSDLKSELNVDGDLRQAQQIVRDVAQDFARKTREAERELDLELPTGVEARTRPGAAAVKALPQIAAPLNPGSPASFQAAAEAAPKPGVAPTAASPGPSNLESTRPLPLD